MNLQNEIVKKSIIGIVSLTGIWTINKVLEHEKMLPVMANDIAYIKDKVDDQDMTYIKETLQDIKRKMYRRSGND